MSMVTGNPKPYPAGTQLKGIVTPHEHDVLSGRGNFVNYHTGNEHFRSLVKKHKIAYVACPKPEKGKFSKIIVDEIRSMEPPGRFLKQDPATKLWQDIGDKKSLDKTRQALREGAPELLKELTGEDPKQKNLQPQSMAAAQAQIQSGGMNNMGIGMVGGSAGTGMLNAGAMGHTPDQQQYFMQQMAQMQAQQQQRQQAQMRMGMGNLGGTFVQQQQQLEQLSSSHSGFGGDAAAGGGGAGLNHPGAYIQQPDGIGSLDNDANNANSIPGAPAMVPLNVINPSGAPLDSDAQAQQDRLLQQQQLLQQQHQKLLQQQELLRQLQEQQRALQQQQMQAVQLEQQQAMVGGANNNNMSNMAGLTDFPGVPGGIGAMNPAIMQNMQHQQQSQQAQAAGTGTGNGPAENVSGLLNQQEQTVPIKPPAPSGVVAGGVRPNRRGSLTFDDLVKGIKSAKAAQKMGMSSTNMSLSVGDIDSNLSSAFEDSLIISVEGSLANSSNSEKKPAAAAGGLGANVASASQSRPSQSNGPGGVPENVTVNQQQPGSGPMGESSILRGMAMSDAGMSFSLSDAADLLGGSVMQMSYRGFPESKQDDQGK